RGREGVGLGDVGAGGVVAVVQPRDDVRPRQAQDVVVALHLAVVVGEALGAEVGLVQALALDHHAPRPVEDQDALLGGRLQGGDAFGSAHCPASCLASSASKSACDFSTKRCIS